MRLPTPKETVVLELLSGKVEMYGLEMVHSSKSLRRGTVYVLLSRMVEKELVTARQLADPHLSGTPRKLYRITGVGQQALAARRAAAAILTGREGFRGQPA